MATRVSPPQNKTYYINPAYITFVEKSGYGANLIQVSASSSCYIFAFDPAGGIGYNNADRNYKRWKVTAYNNRFPDNDFYYIYARLERKGLSALIVYDKKLRGTSGGLITDGVDENGNPVKQEGEADPDYLYIRIGEVTATDGRSIRQITYDTGYLTSDESLNDKSDASEMWELDKYSTPWLIKAKHWLTSFTLKGFITLIGGLIFKKEGGEGKPIVDVMRTTDSGDPNEPNYVPIDDTTIPTTAWVKSQNEDRYLKKYEPDETRYRIKFFDGIECGYFVKGMIGGSGTQFDGQGYGEMNGLTLREFLEVPELRFNRIDVVSGELWNSIAFGLVEKVDTVEQKCWIKLEERERAGLHVYDICRGIFADFGDGTQWEGVDECGFLHLYGFWTAYFTPTEIIENGEGVFCFRYQLKPGTTQHPTPSMKFAVYGNFVDKTRQASAYSTRTYKRYLNNVDTWVIDPDKHIYAQYGELNGLTIGGQTMTGYGSFQHNCYFTGTQIQFTPQQKLELQGESAYSVVLSDYEGVVTIDDEGNIIGGEMELQNVITGERNVITDGQNVVTAGYRLKTQVQAMKGSEPLFYTPTSPTEGSFAMAISTVGCTAMVINGVVVVTSVFHTERCYVTINVNCEGYASFTQTYHITAIRDGKNPIIADIDNEMDSVACDSSGKVLFGLPVSCTVSMWAGTGKLELDRLEISAPEGVTYTSDKNTGVITVTDITKEAERTLPLNITAYASYGGTQYHKNLVFTVNKVNAGENALLYKLSPDVSSVKVDDAGIMTAESVRCRVVSSDGSTITTLGSLPEGVTMQYFRNDAQPAAYEYNTPVSINSGTKTVTFRLYVKDALVDVETIPILLDGSSPLVVDLDNEMQSVACDENGNVTLGLPLSTGVKAFYGSKELTITSLTVGTVSGVKSSVSGTTVTVTEIAQSAVENIRIPITVKATHDKEYTRTVYLIVNKLKQGNSSVVVDLVPSVSAIKVNDEGVYTPSTVSCVHKVTTGKNGASIPAYIQENYTMKYAIDGDTTPDAYTYGNALPAEKVMSAKSSVTFYLYYKGVLVDRETVPVIKDGASPVVIDLDNEMQSVACDENGNVTLGLPLSTGVKMYYGTEALTISSLTVTPPAGVTVTKTASSVTVTAITAAAAETLKVNISATASYGGETYTKSATLTVNKLKQGNSAVVLDLSPSVTAVKVNAAGTYTPTSVSCKVKQTTGKNGATTPSSLPSGYSMKYKLDSGSETAYTYGDAITVTSATAGITFYLYYGSTLVDRETVPVIKDGASPVVLDLDNEMQSVACDESGNVLAGLPLSTGVKMYYGSEAMTISSLTATAPTGVTVTKTTSSVTVTAITAAAADTLKVSISATGTYGKESFTKTAVLTVNKLKQGNSAVVLDLTPSVTAVKVNAAGTYTPTSVSCKVKQTTGKDGATTPSALPSGYSMKYKLDSGSETAYTYGDAITVTSATAGITFYLYYGSTLVDRETVPVIKDGASPVVLDLDNEMQSVACDESGNVLAGLPLSTGVKMYYGSEAMTISSLTATAPTGVTVTKTTSSVTVTAITAAAADTLKVSISATGTYGKESFTKSAVLTVNKLKQGNSAVVLDLSPSVTAVKVNAAGTYTPTSVSCKVKQTTGKDGATTPSALPSGYSMKYKLDSGSETAYTYGNSVTVTSSTSGITFFLYYGSTLVDRETVPVVRDGTNGTNGKDGTNGTDGTDGKDGADAEFHTIEASVANIGYTMTGGYSPSQFIVSEYHVKGASKVSSNDFYIHITGVKTTGKTYLTYTSNTKEYVFNAGSYQSYDFDSFLFELRSGSSSSSSLISSTNVSVAKQGAAGASGAMPRYCGVFSYGSGIEYVYNDEYRDIVVYEANVYQVLAKGMSVPSTILPTDTSYWEKANKFSFVAMDTAFADNANIAGFMFAREGYDSSGAPVGSLRSQSSNGTVSYSNNGAWEEDGAYRKSPVISDGGFTKEIITFSVSEDCTVMIEISASSEQGYDIGYVGRLDKTYTSRSEISADFQTSVSGTNSSVSNIKASAGTHTVEVIYTKDGSASRNEDCVRYRFIGSPKLYMSAHTGKLLCTDVNLTGTINAVSGAIGGFNIIDGMITGGESYPLVINPSDDGYPSIKWMKDGYSYAWLGMNTPSGGYVSGQLTLSDVAGRKTIMSPSYTEITGSMYTMALNASLSTESTFTITRSGATGGYKVGVGMDSSGYVRIGATRWPTSSSSVNVGEMYLDGTTVKVRTS